MTKLEELKAAWYEADAAFAIADDAFETAAAWATDAWHAYQDELNKQKENSND